MYWRGGPLRETFCAGAGGVGSFGSVVFYMRYCCVRLWPRHVFYRRSLIAGNIHYRNGNRIYYIRAGAEKGLGLVCFYMWLLHPALSWVCVLLLRLSLWLHTLEEG